MSLNILGIRDFPILHRQFSSSIQSSPSVSKSSFGSSFSSSEAISPNPGFTNPTPTMIPPSTPPQSSFNSPERELAQDSKDVLVQRLQDLAARLSLADDEDLHDHDVAALHKDVDRMERLLRVQHAPKPRHTHDEYQQQHMFWHSAPPFSPTRSQSRSFNGSLQPTLTPSNDTSGALDSNLLAKTPDQNVTVSMTSTASSKRAILLTNEADALFNRLSITVQELQERREESDHINALLLTKLEKAAQTILALESQVEDLATSLTATLADLSILRIQLRALEVQGQSYFDFIADEELTRGIEVWKGQWKEVDERTRGRIGSSKGKARWNNEERENSGSATPKSVAANM